VPKLYDTQTNVYTAAKERLRDHYRAGDRLVISISGGKDSTVIMELAIEVAREEGLLPVEVITRDEEIMYPGTFEYLERVAQRNEVSMNWVIAGQPIINAYNRYYPYWWVFDPEQEDKWVRRPPSFAQYIPEQNIAGMTTTTRFPTPNRLIAVIGLRADESLTRANRIASTRTALTKHPSAYGAYNLAPIYDWTDEDVWKAIRDKGWDYNRAYNELFQVGVHKKRLRIAPPSMSQGMDLLKYALRLWPSWFDKADQRIPGIRTVARFGKRALMPFLNYNETWEQCYQRLIEDAEANAPWLAQRMHKALADHISHHAAHSTTPIPMVKQNRCLLCKPKNPGSWQGLCLTMYNGDPWSHNNQELPPLEPYTLREGAKGWFEKGKKGALHW
jgi:predicted phosphoadenosine phosphosulfate sulfurtransferase